MEWTNEFALALVDEYEKKPILWDPKHLFHFSRNKKIDAWETIAESLNINVADAKQKMNSLLGSLRREKAKGKKSMGTGKDRTEIYVSKWFAFKRMQFLLDKDEPVTTINTEKLTHNNDRQEEADETEVNDLQVTDEVSTDHNNSEIPDDTPDATPKPLQIKKARKKNEDSTLEEAFRILKQSAAAVSEPADSCSIYGQYIANKLKTYSQRTRSEVEYRIYQIVYEADIGKYDIAFTHTQYPHNQYPEYVNTTKSLSAPSPSLSYNSDSTSHASNFLTSLSMPHLTN